MRAILAMLAVIAFALFLAIGAVSSVHRAQPARVVSTVCDPDAPIIALNTRAQVSDYLDTCFR